jgi:hypothetical protein
MRVEFYLDGKLHALRDWNQIPSADDFVELPDGTYKIVWRLFVSTRYEDHIELTCVREAIDGQSS